MTFCSWLEAKPCFSKRQEKAMIWPTKSRRENRLESQTMRRKSKKMQKRQTAKNEKVNGKRKLKAARCVGAQPRSK